MNRTSVQPSKEQWGAYSIARRQDGQDSEGARASHSNVDNRSAGADRASVAVCRIFHGIFLRTVFRSGCLFKSFLNFECPVVYSVCLSVDALIRVSFCIVRNNVKFCIVRKFLIFSLCNVNDAISMFFSLFWLHLRSTLRSVYFPPKCWLRVKQLIHELLEK